MGATNITMRMELIVKHVMSLVRDVMLKDPKDVQPAHLVTLGIMLLVYVLLIVGLSSMESSLQESASRAGSLAKSAMELAVTSASPARLMARTMHSRKGNVTLSPAKGAMLREIQSLKTLIVSHVTLIAKTALGLTLLIVLSAMDLKTGSRRERL